jgi:hypothetical protein
MGRSSRRTLTSCQDFILTCKFLFPKATRGFERISYRGVQLSILLHATVYMFLYNLLNVLVQIANKMGFKKLVTTIQIFFYCIVTGDESRVFWYDPETKRQSRPQSQRFRLLLLITVYDSQGVIHEEWVLEGQGVGSSFYAEFIGRLLKRISRVKLQFRAEGSSCCTRQCPFPILAFVKSFLANHAVLEIIHPPFSPDLVAADFSFPKVKTVLRILRTLRKK